MSPETIDVVMPCLDEAEALPWVLGRMPSWARAIVADNGSGDGSADIARSLGATVIDVSARGYGSACHAGLEAATADLVAFMDADASLDPRQLASLHTALVGDVGTGVGCRRPVSREAGAEDDGAPRGGLEAPVAEHRGGRVEDGLPVGDLGLLTFSGGEVRDC